VKLLISGTIKFHYLGPSGRHTEVYVDGEFKRGFFFTNTSILLLLWCACDILNKDLESVLTNGYERVESSITDNIIKDMGDRSLMSKYDILFDDDAVVNAYLFIKNAGLTDMIGSLLDIHDKFIIAIRDMYNIEDLEVIYELQDDEIYTDSTIQ
jgi:hypothetical protein